MVEKIPFPSHLTHRLPPPPPFNPNNTPPLRARAPSPNVHPKACDACVAGGGWGGQRRCEGAEERDTMATTTTTTTATTLPLPQTDRTLAPAPLSLEKQQQSTFKVASGDGEVTEGETIRRRTTDDDNDEKKLNNQIMRGLQRQRRRRWRRRRRQRLRGHRQQST